MYKPHPKLVIILVQVCPYMDVVGLMYDIVDTDDWMKYENILSSMFLNTKHPNLLTKISINKKIY